MEFVLGLDDLLLVIGLPVVVTYYLMKRESRYYLRHVWRNFSYNVCELIFDFSVLDKVRDLRMIFHRVYFETHRRLKSEFSLKRWLISKIRQYYDFESFLGFGLGLSLLGGLLVSIKPLVFLGFFCLFIGTYFLVSAFLVPRFYMKNRNKNIKNAT